MGIKDVGSSHQLILHFAFNDSIHLSQQHQRFTLPSTIQQHQRFPLPSTISSTMSQQHQRLQSTISSTFQRLPSTTMRVHYTAEVAWIRDGKGRLPLEIAFVEVGHPSRVYILQTKFRNDDVHTTRFSLRDLALNKSLRRNADRLDARFRLDGRDLVSPRRVVETDEWSWRSDVKRMIGDDRHTSLIYCCS
ncbi:hypothetical protein AVEN_151998-1 [Araneus ventricosus]|uniref:Uncharacterized protein n=1 Tax=Araneus ventricosus TaxID=182803 RepID=A0A4Y2L622_ARAVE|nr:hypothetical protein AVEN_151998-1 [Araneus ventricosus]